MDSKPVKMWGEKVLVAGLWVRACRLSKCAAGAIVYWSGLGGLRSQAEKLFRSGLIVVGPDWLNVTLCRGLVLRPCIDLVPEEFPVGSWHCWNLPQWISSQHYASVIRHSCLATKTNKRGGQLCHGHKKGRSPLVVAAAVCWLCYTSVIGTTLLLCDCLCKKINKKMSRVNSWH